MLGYFKHFSKIIDTFSKFVKTKNSIESDFSNSNHCRPFLAFPRRRRRRNVVFRVIIDRSINGQCYILILHVGVRPQRPSERQPLEGTGSVGIGTADVGANVSREVV